MSVTNVAELGTLPGRVKQARREYTDLSQRQVDKLFRAAALAAAGAPKGLHWRKWPAIALNRSGRNRQQRHYRERATRQCLAATRQGSQSRK